MHRKTNGFTLIELLIVVVIIGIIITLAVGQYQKMLDRTREAEAITNIRAAWEALRLYYTEHGYYYPTDLGNGTDPSAPDGVAEINEKLGVGIQYKYFNYFYDRPDAQSKPTSFIMKAFWLNDEGLSPDPHSHRYLYMDQNGNEIHRVNY
jgi:prepilin-type N-terminal cleavage/methylation domain-containing protein